MPWHRIYYATEENRLLPRLGLPEGDGIPYLDALSADAGETMWKLAPGLAFADGGAVACAPFSYLEMHAVVQPEEPTWWGGDDPEGLLLSQPTYAEFVTAVTSLHTQLLCWFYSIGYSAPSIRPTPPTVAG